MRTGFDYARAMAPFWLSTTQYDESLLMVSAGAGLPEARLLFRPEQIVSLTDSALRTEYVYGIDWLYDPVANAIRLPAGSRAPFLTEDELYPPVPGPDTLYRTGGGHILGKMSGGFFHEKQLAVTYRIASNDWGGPVPVFEPGLLPRTIGRLTAGSPLKIAFFGDSITLGADASGYLNVPPFMPGWEKLVERKLIGSYSSAVSTVNLSLYGKNSIVGAESAAALVAPEKPDLVVVAFGMNDGAVVSPDAFRNNIRTIIQDVKAGHPPAEFILVSTMLPNPETSFYAMQASYREELAKLVGPGVALADMTRIHQELLLRKPYRDMTGNHINHPNDYLVRWYAQVVSALLVPG